jgi:hypothetical protein
LSFFCAWQLGCAWASGGASAALNAAAAAKLVYISPWRIDHLLGSASEGEAGHWNARRAGLVPVSSDAETLWGC